MSKLPEITERQRFWLEHLQACGDRSLKSYAEEHGLEVSSLYEAKSRLKRKGLVASDPARFVRVQCSEPASAPALCRIHLRNGTMVEVACESQHWSILLRNVAELA